MSVEAKKLIDLTRLSRFKELMDQSVDGKLSRLKLNLVQVVSTLPELDAAEEGVLYLVPTGSTGEYDLYAKEADGGVVQFVKNSSLSISGDLDGFLLKADADKKYISTATSENGTITGAKGDQTGRESNIRAYYSYPWDGTLYRCHHCQQRRACYQGGSGRQRRCHR